MYPQKVLQGIPNRKRTIEISIFNFLIMPQCHIQLICHLLLRHPRSHSGVSEILSHSKTPVLEIFREAWYNTAQEIHSSK